MQTNLLNKSLSIALIHIRKWASTPRMYILLIIIFGFTYSMISPIKDFCINYDAYVNPLIIPFFVNNNYNISMILLGVVLLFCDAPFIEQEQAYVILRARRTPWVFGQIIYILLSSVIYYFYLVIINIIILFPRVEFSFDWGKVVNTLVRDETTMFQGIMLNFDREISSLFTPLQAMSLHFWIFVLISTSIGLLVFLLNFLVNRKLGPVVASIIAILPLIVERFDEWLVFFSPASWIGLSNLDFEDTKTYAPSLTYVFCVASLCIILLSVAIILVAKKKDIEILKDI